MRFASPLQRGRLVQRYKRFLADIVLEDGRAITATCPNTGSMLGLTGSGSAVWVSRSDRATRKYPHTWEMVEHDLGKGPQLVGINTGHPNRLVEEAIAAGRIGELASYPGIRREVRYGVNSRIDLLLTGEDGRLCYVEIKNVHLSRTAGLAEFPDCVTERGIKHLRELGDMVEQGHRAVMLYLIQRGDVLRMQLAGDLDPGYAAAFDVARRRGVEALAYACDLTPEGIEVSRAVPLCHRHQASGTRPRRKSLLPGA